MVPRSLPVAIPVAEEVSLNEPPFRVPVVTPEEEREERGRLGAAIEWLFGLASLFLGLAILTSIPLLQFLTLGYLLEAGGRIARSGRLRDGFIGVRKAARAGEIALGCFLFWLPLYGLSYMAERARIIDPVGAAARQWDQWLLLLTVLCAAHASAACLRGGRLRMFFRPLNIVWLLRRASYINVLREAREKLWESAIRLRLSYYFWLGVRGFAGAFLWLLVPVVLLGQGHRFPALGVLGGLLLGLATLYLPFLQTRFARDNRLRAFLEVRAVRRDFCSAPLAFALALSILLLSAIPPYVLKIELIPRDLLYLEGMVFLALIFPARLLLGWAYSRPTLRPGRRPWLLLGATRIAVLPVVAAYVLVVFASQHVGWYGISGLFEQHAFLLPVPFAR